MHKFGVALTIVLGVIGFWEADLKGLDAYEPVLLPILGILLFGGFLKMALSRA